MEERNFNLNNLVSLGFLILFFIALIFVARGVFYILSLAAPVHQPRRLHGPSIHSHGVAAGNH